MFFLKEQKGGIIIYLIIVIAIFLIITPPLVSNFLAKMQLMRLSMQREQAFQIAEAGINYYQWHLAHYEEDYTDYQGVGALPDVPAASTVMGPYEHDYIDKDTQETIGRYSLLITSPLVGSTIVTIQSTGWTTSNPSITRTITVKYGIPSLAQYSLLTNDGICAYVTDESFSGRIHANNGIRFDAIADAPIESVKSTYTCPSWQGDGCPTTKNGVWGSAPPSTQAFWKYPVPAIDFSALTSNLATMKTSAENNGIYLPPSNQNGYSLVFNSDGTVSIYKVTSLLYNPSAQDGYYVWHSEYIDYDNRTILSGYDHHALPSNGIIYIEDKTWIEGIVNGRVTVAAAQLPYNASTAPTIYIPNNITYDEKDGSSVLGLISQKDIVVTYHAPNNLEIDAAMVAQNGLVEFFAFIGNIKNNITIYGSVMSFGYWFDNFVWTSGYTNNVVAGYRYSSYNYDSNLLYAPPPDFPFSSSGYQLITWSSN